jgi:curved DNA-binding protein CbpA
MNLYEILGVTKDADQKTIKSAYRIKAQLLHPDKQNGNNQEFLKVKRAYEILSNPERRKLYDANGTIDEKHNIDIFLMAKQQIGTLFIQFCMNQVIVNPLEATKKQILSSKQELLKQKDKCFSNRKLLLRRKKNLSYKNEKEKENLLNSFITNTRVGNIESYKDIKQKLKLCDFMLEYIADYSYYEEEKVIKTSVQDYIIANRFGNSYTTGSFI